MKNPDDENDYALTRTELSARQNADFLKENIGCFLDKGVLQKYTSKNK